MSASSVGKAFEKKVEAFLTERGYTVQRTWPKYSFFRKTDKSTGLPQKELTVLTTRQDFFACADLIAIHPDKQKTFFIQCTTGEASHRRPKLEALPWNFQAQHVTLWKRMDSDKQQVKIYRLNVRYDLEGEPREWTDMIYNFRKKNDDVLRSMGI